jgi:hypothetical protein
MTKKEAKKLKQELCENPQLKPIVEEIDKYAEFGKKIIDNALTLTLLGMWISILILAAGVWFGAITQSHILEILEEAKNGKTIYYRIP